MIDRHIHLHGILFIAIQFILVIITVEIKGYDSQPYTFMRFFSHDFIIILL